MVPDLGTEPNNIFHNFGGAGNADLPAGQRVLERRIGSNDDDEDFQRVPEMMVQCGVDEDTLFYGSRTLESAVPSQEAAVSPGLHDLLRLVDQPSDPAQPEMEPRGQQDLIRQERADLVRPERANFVRPYAFDGRPMYVPPDQNRDRTSPVMVPITSFFRSIRDELEVIPMFALNVAACLIDLPAGRSGVFVGWCQRTQALIIRQDPFCL